MNMMSISEHTQLYSPSKAATIKNKQNKEKEANERHLQQTPRRTEVNIT